jgi:PKHD-type hydroxylase
MVGKALDRHPAIFPSALPQHMLPPACKRYSGGELLIVEGHSEQRVKLPASHLVLHPNTRAHEMAPVTRGERLAGFFWIKSMVRNGAQRRILLDMDVALNQLRQ